MGIVHKLGARKEFISPILLFVISQKFPIIHLLLTERKINKHNKLISYVKLCINKQVKIIHTYKNH